MGKDLNRYQIQVNDVNDNPITSGLRLAVQSAPHTNATIYADADKTALTNPITQTVFDALGEGVVDFYSYAPSLDIAVFDNRGSSQLFETVTPDKCRLVFVNKASRIADKRISVEFFDDFLGGYVSGDRWTLATDDSGSCVIEDAADGIVNILTDGSDNDGSVLSSTDETYIVQTDKNIYFEARVKWTEIDATNYDASTFIGLADESTVGILVDATAIPIATLDGIGFYKTEAIKYWNFITSNATDQEKTEEMLAFVTNTWYTVAFYIDCNDGVTATVTPYINGKAYTAHDLTISGMLEMSPTLAVKTFGNQVETLKCDYVRVVADRDN